ncbi:GxxExxY protein [Desulfatibacillum aliphaticivorans]|uniref:GxxExxY protein n=1 Tax=Desulfatibacillum aliphaticivorans TaxID=218208 RepID=UPI00041DDC8A|nr:GxxExxY protein [Desulfatibacillum aliphaticivorans]
MSNLIFERETYVIRGAVFEVYSEMGCGFLEAVYQECLETELSARGVPFVAQPDLKLNYKGRILQQFYKPDLVCYSQIILEIKAVKEIAAEHQAQIINYLKGSGLKLGLLINFGSYPKAQIQRFAF